MSGNLFEENFPLFKYKEKEEKEILLTDKKSGKPGLLKLGGILWCRKETIYNNQSYEHLQFHSYRGLLLILH